MITSDQMRDAKKRLRHGDIRELARRMDAQYPKVFNALDGFIKSQEFRTRLLAEIDKLIEERAAAEAAA